MANEPMDRITMPAALSAFRLRSRLGCRKQVVIGHRGRSTKNMKLLLPAFFAFMMVFSVSAEQIKSPTETTTNLSLTGTIVRGLISNTEVSFIFTGTLVFTINNYSDQGQTIRMEVRELPVSSIRGDDSAPQTPYSRTYKNAVEVITTRSEDRIQTSVEVVSPTIRFDQSGKIMAITGQELGFFPPISKTNQ
jgi:hypothetical protein